MENFVKDSFWGLLLREFLFSSKEKANQESLSEINDVKQYNSLEYANMILIHWNNKNNKQNPKNWSIFAKRYSV